MIDLLLAENKISRCASCRFLHCS